MLRTYLTTNKTSANVTETESSPITILSAEKQAFAALFCKGIVRQATKQMPNPAFTRTTYARAFVRAFLKNGLAKFSKSLCPCFCAGILLSRSFDARDAPNKPYFQRKLTDSLSNIFNALPAIFCTAEVLSLLLLRKLQLHSITAIRKLKCTNPLKKQPAVNAHTKASVRKTLQMPPLFAAAVLQCRS